MAELIHSTKDVFNQYLRGRIYRIPEYQRGYKWSHLQIKQLLNDISEFDDKLNEDLFYCLQNITLYPSKTENNVLHIVDGQQRLTTTYLLYCYLELEKSLSGQFHYAVRESSNTFIQRLKQDRQVFIDIILTSSSFDDFCKTSQEIDYDHQDIFYMYNAIKTFKEWFLSTNTNVDLFKNKFVNKVKFIVNEIHSDINEQELFMNLNTGRVPLDGSDLIRAIIITRVARDEMQMQNLTEPTTKEIVRLNEKRTRIGWELDQLNQWWSNKDVRNYFKSFRKIEVDSEENINFNIDINPINILYSLWAETQVEPKEKLKLLLFERIPPLVLYQELVFLNRSLQDWFKDKEIYHLIGYLANNYRLFSFRKYYELWLSFNQTRVKFISTLKSDIKDCVFGDGKKENSGPDFWLGSMLDYNEENKTNWYDLPELEKFLVLIDIIEILKNKEIPFLSPLHFKKNNEDKEHIYPCTPKTIKEFEKNDNNNFELIQTYLKKLKDLTGDLFPNSEKEWNDKNTEEKEDVLRTIEINIHSKTPINSIGNLVLLHYSINRGFGNDYYIDKRASIIKNVQNGEYVRQHTLSVFVKGRSDSSNLNDWYFEDIKKNADYIEQSIRFFFGLIIEKDEQPTA